jgi:hypothetical protein
MTRTVTDEILHKRRLTAFIIAISFIIIVWFLSSLFEDKPTQTTTRTTTSPTCLDVSNTTLEWISLEIKSGYSLGTTKAIKSNDHTQVYLISTRVFVNGEDQNNIATFSSNTISGTGTIWPVDDNAKTISNWLHSPQNTRTLEGRTFSPITERTHGYQLSRSCVR